MADGVDPFNLDRFVAAQASSFDTALAEIKAGHKRTHWMWFIFPQLRGLGRSATAELYGIASLDEARAYLRHALLGPRLITCTQAVIANAGRTLGEIFRTPDDLKFRSSMTLFEAAAGPSEPVFTTGIERCCSGGRDERTLRQI